MEITQLATSDRSEPSESVGPWAGVKTSNEVLASGESLQVGARLKLALGLDKRIIAVGGIKDEDGSSRLTASLGAALASLDNNSVLVIDANTGSSQLSGIFGACQAAGLLDVLDEKAELNPVVKRVSAGNLFFLALGRSNRSLASLIGGSRCNRVIDQIRHQYRYVLVDCGTVCESPDNMLLASRFDGIVGAVAAAARRRAEILTFQQALQRLTIPLLGIVLTKGGGK